jgi:putative MATE family efflux protein
MDLTTGSIKDHIREIGLPASIGFFFNTMFNVVDTFFAGLVSTEAVAALSLSFPVFFIILAVVQGLSSGASALISNAIGAKNEKEAEHIAAQILTFGVFCYGLLSVVGLYVSTPIFELLGAKGQYLEMVRAYMDVIFIGSLFFILAYTANSILYAHGKSRYIRNFLIFGFFLNAALNPWFLFGGFGIPAMGLKGIALATVVTMICGSIYIFYKVIQEGYLKIVSWRDFIPQKAAFWNIAKQSLPSSLNMMTVGTGIFVITYFVKNFGEAAIAAYGIGMRIEQITLLPSIGLTIATLSIVGQNNGAGKIDRVEEAIRLNLYYGGWIACFGLIFMTLFAKPLYLIFTRNEEVLNVGIPYLHVAAFTCGAYILLTIHIAALQGIKKPHYALIFSFLRQIIAPICIFSFLINRLHEGIISIWWSIFTITWSAAFATMFVTRHLIKKRKEEILD